jgi:hypothetical protein
LALLPDRIGGLELTDRLLRELAQLPGRSNVSATRRMNSVAKSSGRRLAHTGRRWFFIKNANLPASIMLNDVPRETTPYGSKPRRTSDRNSWSIQLFEIPSWLKGHFFCLKRSSNCPIREIHWQTGGHTFTRHDTVTPAREPAMSRRQCERIVPVLNMMRAITVTSQLAANDLNGGFHILQNWTGFVWRQQDFVTPFASLYEHLITSGSLPNLDGRKRAKPRRTLRAA